MDIAFASRAWFVQPQCPARLACVLPVPPPLPPSPPKVRGADSAVHISVCLLSVVDGGRGEIVREENLYGHVRIETNRRLMAPALLENPLLLVPRLHR